ncbi:ribonuclease H-like domain-containing protein [Tanacetum coccineum]
MGDTGSHHGPAYIHTETSQHTPTHSTTNETPLAQQHLTPIDMPSHSTTTETPLAQQHLTPTGPVLSSAKSKTHNPEQPISPPIDNPNPVLVHLMVTRFRVGLNRSTERLNLYVSTISPLPKSQGTDTAYLLLHIDDIILTASSEHLLHQIIDFLHLEFSMTDLGALNYFLGIYVTCDSSGMFLSQRKYPTKFLELANMASYNLSRTPVDTESKLRADGDHVSDLTLYRSLASSLQYLTFTRPDIYYAVQHVCLYMNDPREPHFSTLKWILMYVRGTLDHGLHCFLPLLHLWLLIQMRIVLGVLLLVDDISAKAEYRGVAMCVAEIPGV